MTSATSAPITREVDMGDSVIGYYPDLWEACGCREGGWGEIKGREVTEGTVKVRKINNTYGRGKL